MSEWISKAVQKGQDMPDAMMDDQAKRNDKAGAKARLVQAFRKVKGKKASKPMPPAKPPCK